MRQHFLSTRIYKLSTIVTMCPKAGNYIMHNAVHTLMAARNFKGVAMGRAVVLVKCGIL